VVAQRRKFAEDVAGGVEARRQLAAEFRDALLRLGPTFIKFGQLLSTRVDVLQPEIIAELSSLQNEVPGFCPERAKAIIKEELKIKYLSEVFTRFDREPLAAASLAQVHRARLLNGDEVIVKVQRDGLRDQFDVDCSNIKFLASVADRLDPENEGVASNWRGIADTSETVLYREINFLIEKDAAKAFRHAFEVGTTYETGSTTTRAKPLPYVKVPRTYDEWCTSRVLVLEYVPGIKINDITTLQRMNGIDLATLSERLTTSYLEQLCRHGFFHCDPHPGNVAVDVGYPGGRIIYYDFGMMESIEPVVKAGFVDLVYALYKNAPVLACDALEQMGVLRPGLDRFSIERVANNYLNSFTATVDSKNARGITGIDADAKKWETEMSDEEQRAARRDRRAQIGKDLFATQADRPFVFPPKFTFVFRALSTIDGIGKSLDPGYDLTRLSSPYLRELADLRDGSRYKSVVGELLEKVGWRYIDLKQLVMQPRNVASADKSIKRIENGDLKLRVRSIELEAQLTRVETRQRMYGTTVIAFFASKLAATILLSTGASTLSYLAKYALQKALVFGAVWAALEATGAYCGLAKIERNKMRFNNQLDDC
jgi:predicted unusual protein kinase regulating ubiquinone biosynthesis (AarF/ABC1/UbiB family)